MRFHGFRRDVQLGGYLRVRHAPANEGAAVLARRCAQGTAPEWVLPLLAFGWIVVATLLRPATTPDQPWASRRLVPGVLPGFILLAVWAVAWLTERLRARGAGVLVRRMTATLLTVMPVLPAAVTSFGLAARRGGPLGVRVVATGTAIQATYQGEIAAVAHLCASLSGNARQSCSPRPAVSSAVSVVTRGASSRCPAGTTSTPWKHHRSAPTGSGQSCGFPSPLRSLRREDRENYPAEKICLASRAA